MPTFLPLDSTSVSNPNQMHLSIIENWMLWPDDEPMRDAALKAAAVAHGQRLKRQGLLSGPVIEDLFDLAVDARPLDQMIELANDPYRQGRVAGEILYLAIEGKHPDGTRPNLTEIKQLLASAYTGKKNTNTSAVESIWHRYRPVSHLWAAHLEYRHRARGAHFPCDLPNIHNLLWASEQWRQLGEGTKSAPRSPGPILPANECVRVPTAMKFSKKDWNTY
jgi:hypothetical protein